MKSSDKQVTRKRQAQVFDCQSVKQVFLYILKK
jgi:hypothetical protein